VNVPKGAAGADGRVKMTFVGGEDEPMARQPGRDGVTSSPISSAASTTAVRMRVGNQGRDRVFWSLAAVVLSVPFVSGIARMGAYVIASPLDLFEIGLEIESLLFPLLCSLLGGFPLISQVSEGYLQQVRTRVPIGAYVRGAVARAGLRAGVVVAVAVFSWWAFCWWVEPLLGLAHDYGASPATPPAEMSTFSQLLHTSSLLYGISYSLWVGLWGALIAALAAVLLIVVPQRLLALALPLIVWWVDNLIWSNLRHPQFAAVFAVFPGGLTQQPVWTVLVPLTLWGGALAMLLLSLERRRYEVSATL